MDRTIKVKMVPHLNHFRSEVSGISTVIKKWFHYLPNFGIELVDPDAESYDLVAAHAGMTAGEVDIAHLHGLYFSADYHAPSWEYEVNSRIVEAIRHARVTTVPSSWVAEIFQRDLRYTPAIVGHGVDWDEWQHKERNEGYVLAYGKNRAGSDVCDPSFVSKLAARFPHLIFMVTFAPRNAPPNVQEIGLLPHKKFKKVIQRAAVVMSPIKETWGVMQAESLAAGIPVLGVKAGGNLDLIEHGLTGYLYEPDNYEDMAQGLDYCLKHRKVLGQNGQEAAKAWTWEEAAGKVAEVYRLAMVEEPPTVSVIIPVYNKKPEQIRRAIQSCLDQSLKPLRIAVVRDGGDDTAFNVCKEFEDHRVQYIPQENQGVAIARNNGAMVAWDSKYLCFLDSDDAIAPRFLESCVAELEADRSLGIAYSGLWYVKANGEEGLSPWPGEWDYDAQLRGANQIPTCNVIRREAWQRLGGQRQRYAPAGAGEEDAELWLRMGAYGWKAKLIEPFPELLQVFNALKEHLRRPPTEQEIITQWGEANYRKAKDSVFIYSWLSGQVSGNKEHKITDYKVWHPWTYGGNHPFASYATPKNFSHPVTQFDQPEISVIIPVGPGHEKEVLNALDSLEAQTFRKWEAIVIWDSKEGIEHLGYTKYTATLRVSDDMVNFVTAYPYVRWAATTGGKGASIARNRGIEKARAPLILFLDADDTLHPQALGKMKARYNQTGEAVYTDYVGQAFIDNELAGKLDREKRLQAYNPKSQEAIIDYQAFEFDCARALRQPDSASPYIWNLITTLFPKRWHEEIGGFDEAMETWEDWDYWLRMVQKGYCFARLPERLVRYRFYTGQRRYLASGDTEEGRQKAEAMLQYIRNKYKGQGDMACGCKKDSSSNGTATTAELQAQGSRDFMADTNFVKARYTGKRGNHHIWGDTVLETNPGPPARKAAGGGWKFWYGYEQQGFITTVYRPDIAARPNDWQIIPDQPIVMEAVRLPAPPVPVFTVRHPVKAEELTIRFNAGTEHEMTMAPTLLAETEETGFDLQQLPGVGAAIALRMISAGLNSRETILKAGIDGLTDVEGITNTRAVAILRALADD